MAGSELLTNSLYWEYLRLSQQAFNKIMNKYYKENGHGLLCYGLIRFRFNALDNDIVNIGLHFFLKNVGAYGASCNGA